MALGYLWTYAYGGTRGVGLGGLVLMAGGYLAALISYPIGNLILASRFASQPATSTVGQLFDTMNETPIRLLVLLRTFPLSNFAALNYYVGACDRYTFKQAMMTTGAFLPLAYMCVQFGPRPQLQPQPQPKSIATPQPARLPTPPPACLLDAVLPFHPFAIPTHRISSHAHAPMRFLQVRGHRWCHPQVPPRRSGRG